jgi:hypothetical protein
MSQQVHIFATRADLEPGLRLIESQHHLRYTARFSYVLGKDRMIIVPHKTPDFETYDSLLKAERLGINCTGEHHTGDDYLIVEGTADVRLKSAIQRKGGIHYFVDQEFNPKSICFSPGGIYEEHNLICGHIGTASEHPESITLYKAFANAIIKGFKKIGTYKVGPEALRLMDQGIRMVTIGTKSPPEYDLKRN